MKASVTSYALFKEQNVSTLLLVNFEVMSNVLKKQVATPVIFYVERRGRSLQNDRISDCYVTSPLRLLNFYPYMVAIFMALWL